MHSRSKMELVHGTRAWKEKSGTVGTVQNRGFGMCVIAGRSDVNVYRRILYKL